MLKRGALLRRYAFGNYDMLARSINYTKDISNTIQPYWIMWVSVCAAVRSTLPSAWAPRSMLFSPDALGPCGIMKQNVIGVRAMGTAGHVRPRLPRLHGGQRNAADAAPVGGAAPGHGVHDRSVGGYAIVCCVFHTLDALGLTRLRVAAASPLLPTAVLRRRGRGRA